MKKMLMVLLTVLMFTGPVMADSVVIQSYNNRNFFNVVTDWSVTIGRNPSEKQRVIGERNNLRAQRREEWDRKHHAERFEHKDNSDHNDGHNNNSDHRNFR